MISDVNDAAMAVVDAASVTVVDRLMRLTAGEVLDAARARRADGGLEFHDLLVLARTMLRENPEVRRALHDRYRHVLLDEFQDTDPIQIEVALAHRRHPGRRAAEPLAGPSGSRRPFVLRR